jgi:hypothetical protein
MKALKVGIINYRSRSAYALKLLKGKKTTSQIAAIVGITPADRQSPQTGPRLP